ncbi:TPA: hypothetical protein ACGOME_000901 [Streptococcus pyogenes]|nr:hypothetical protein ETT44_07065 [Streptococcus pyogenes]
MTKGLSYREVDIVTNRMANQIMQKIGVNQRVVILPHGINQILAIIAILKSNNCYVPKGGISRFFFRYI